MMAEMKFGKRMKEQAIESWRIHYMDYTHLKVVSFTLFLVFIYQLIRNNPKLTKASPNMRIR
jgi:hypothetical protein